MSAGTLSPDRRGADLERLTDGELDVLVVGGGVTGAGVALDGAARGLAVGLVEAQDWAAGTSSRSSKLIHGGLRYLEMLDIELVHQALRERGLLLKRLAPHLVHPVPILYPLRRRGVERVYVGAGIALYELLALSTRTTRGLPRHRHLSRRGALAVAPGLRPDALVGAVEYYDAQVDDARFVLELVRAAAGLGAVPVSRLAVEGFRRDGERISGVTVRDAETGATAEIRARVTILATGVWTEETEALAGRVRAVRVRPSKGIHVLVPRDRLASTSALILRTERSVLFVLPWGRHWLIGTTDTDWDLDKARPVATATDVDYLLDHVNTVLAEPLGRDDVDAAFAGLRPLVAGLGVVRGPGEKGGGKLGRVTREDTGTTTVSREHAVARPAPGLVVVSGGKFTTYRVMAADAVDAAVAEGGFSVGASDTAHLPLPGATGFRARWAGRDELARRHGLARPQVERLLHRYGGLVDDVLDVVERDPSSGAPVPGAPDYLRAEIRHAVTHEGARHLDDVLARRTRIGIETRHRGLDSAEAVAALMAPLLGWDDAARAAELDAYRRGVELERAAEAGASDDAAARLLKEAPSFLPLP